MELGLAFISLRLTFGGAPNPNIWSIISESITDLANAILQLEDWDPAALHSPMQSKVPNIEENVRTEKFAEALPLAIEIPLDCFAKADVYIDDTTTVVVEDEDNCLKAVAAVLLAIHIVGRAVWEDEQISRVNLVSVSKLIAEAKLEETKILLGWLLDSRLLTVALPFDKFKAWTDNIEQILQSKSSSHDELETLIGRLGHTTTVNVFAKHFMSRLRSEMDRASNRKKIKLKEEALNDLELHREFLKLAHSGISMNQISYRKPTHVYRSDACPAGLGGYSSQGRAWRWEIPPNLRFRATINMLEHLGATIGPWIDILKGNFEDYSCVLSMTDSTTSAGWLRKSNFKESESEHPSITKAKLDISRNHALRLLKAKSRDYSQWFPGAENDVADSLSHAEEFKNFSSPARNRLVSLLDAAESARRVANTRKTQDQQDRSWIRWNKFLQDIELGKDPFLDRFSRRQRTIIISAFSQAVQEGQFSRAIHDTLVSTSVKATVDGVSKTFREFDRIDPRLDREGNLSRILQMQFKGYKETDPRTEQQKAVPLRLIRHLISSASSPSEEALALLCTGAVFFCMRSCEYLKVPQQDDRKTKLLRLRNFRFFKNGRETDLSSPSLSDSEIVSITFEDQKNREKFETVHLHRSQDDDLCPVKAWAKTIRRILSYPGASKDSPINTFRSEGKHSTFSSSNVIALLRKAAEDIGEESLGFKKNEIGTHLIRSGGAMAMYLARIQVFSIKLIGRWKSDAFLRYIRKQVQQFSENISDNMVTQENFSHIPEFSIPFANLNKVGWSQKSFQDH